MQPTKQENSIRTRLNLSSGNISKGLSGDALWNDVVASAGKYTSTSEFGCFAAGTLVHTEQGLVPIQDIKVGDRVLAKPESGEGEVSYKPVLKTFEHKDKELWLVKVEKHWSDEDIHGRLIDPTIYRYTDMTCEFIATPNHPVWVVGMGVWDGRQSLEEIIAYPQPHWKRVDQLQQHEVVVNKDGILFIIERAQPVYHFQNENVESKISHMWYQHYRYYDTYMSLDEFEGSEISKDYADYQDYLKYCIHQDKKGRVVDIEHYYATNRTGLSVKDINGNPFLENFAHENNYIPFTDTVYNLEVAEDHTYFVTIAGIWVHNTDCNKGK